MKVAILLWMLLALGASCTGRPASMLPPKSVVEDGSLTPQEAGISRAKADIKNGRFRILYYGKPWSAGKPLIDDETGLPVEVVAGCIVTSDFAAEINAYNRTMRKEVSQDEQTAAQIGKGGNNG